LLPAFNTASFSAKGKTMHDQATELRNLIRRCATESPAPHDAPRKLVVSAGKGGVGTTTIAVNLAVTLARSGWRTILCDADLNGGDATWLCGVEAAHSIGDVLSGRRTVHEVLQPGPDGIQLVPGLWSPSAMPDCSPSAQQRLLRELDELGRHAEWIVIDAGSGLNQVVRRFWEAADELLLVTTTDAVSIMDAYAAVKLFVTDHPSAVIRTVVNQSPQAVVASGVHARLALAAQRFLGLGLLAGGSVPWDPALPLATSQARPLRADDADSPAGQAIRLMAQELAAAARGAAHAAGTSWGDIAANQYASALSASF
jgi:flagellar biosynthesis protein FlhG